MQILFKLNTREKILTVFSLIFFTVVFPSFLFSSPQKELSVRRRTTMAYFGTVSQIVVYDDFSRGGAPENWQSCWDEVKALLADLEIKFSAEIPQGDVGRFNALKSGESVAISKETAEVILMAKEAYRISGGAYNPAVYLLTDLWGFTPRFRLPVQSRPAMPYDREGGPAAALPGENYIEAFTRLADFGNCVLSTDGAGGFLLSKNAADEEIDGRLYSLKLDLGGIGKGYAAEKAAELLHRYGYRYGLVNIGTSSFRLLENYGDERKVSSEGLAGPDLWPVNIRFPFDGDSPYITAFGKNEGVSTSGNYDNFYIIHGRQYGHIINTKTGYPADGEIISASVIGGDSAWDDAVTTALLLMSIEEARRFMEEHLQDYQVILILRDGGIISNTGRYRLNG